MTNTSRPCLLKLLGAFHLSDADGRRIEISSRKGVALIAMLAMASQGERSREWILDRLWASRGRSQALSSLRRELSELRRLMPAHPRPSLTANHLWVRLDLDQFRIDARPELTPDTAPTPLPPGEFLEGVDIPGENGFEEWLREQRTIFRERQLRDLQSARPAMTGPADDQASSSNLAAATPPPGFADKAALAVLPLDNRTGDAGLQYLAEGLSEDIIDRLARLRWLPIISRGSSFAVSDIKGDTAALGRRLGARYLLDGALRSGASGNTVSVRLSDTSVGTVLWTERLDLPAHASQDAVDQIVAMLVGSLDARIERAEQQRARGNRTGHRGVNDLIWRGRWHINRLTREDAQIAADLFSEALRIDPTSTEALIQYTYNTIWSAWARRSGKAEVLEMRKLAQRAMLADPDDGRGHFLAAIAEVWLRQPLRAQALLRRAIELNPSLATAYRHLGGSYNLAGEPEKAIDPLHFSLRLSPNDEHTFYAYGELALAHSLLGNWDYAVQFADQSIARRSRYWYAHVIKVNALVRGVKPRFARDAARELMAAVPDFSRAHIEWLPFVDRKWTDHLIEGVETAIGAPLLTMSPAAATTRPKPD